MNGKKIASLVATGVAALAVGGGFYAPVVFAQTPAPAVPGTGQRREHPEKSPHLRRALHALMNAKAQLQMADHDSAGHREQALDLVQRAIDQAKAAIGADR